MASHVADSNAVEEQLTNFLARHAEETEGTRIFLDVHGHGLAAPVRVIANDADFQDEGNARVEARLMGLARRFFTSGHFPSLPAGQERHLLCAVIEEGEGGGTTLFNVKYHTRPYQEIERHEDVALFDTEEVEQQAEEGELLFGKIPCFFCQKLGLPHLVPIPKREVE